MKLTASWMANETDVIIKQIKEWPAPSDIGTRLSFHRELGNRISILIRVHPDSEKAGELLGLLLRMIESGALLARSSESEKLSNLPAT